MPTFDIWVEGYAATGERSGATLLAKGVKASSFEEACNTYFAGNDLFDRTRLTYWACRLFDNEAEARRSFG